MPLYFPENNQPLPADCASRSLQKWNGMLYQTFGNQGPNYFQEGSRPIPTDDPQRSLQKINAILYSINRETLLDGLLAYWKLDEASGERFDATCRGNTLAAINSPLSAAGIINDGASFVAASTQYLKRANNSDLRFDGNFTISAWVYLDSNASAMAAVSKYGFTGGAMDNFILSYDQASDRLQGYLGAGDTTNFVTVSADVFGSPPTGEWIFIVCWREASTFYISVNNGTADSVDASTIPVVLVGTANFNISGVQDTFSVYWDGRIDEVGKWSRALTSSERADLYNSGSGLSYSNF